MVKKNFKAVGKDDSKAAVESPEMKNTEEKKKKATSKKKEVAAESKKAMKLKDAKKAGLIQTKDRRASLLMQQDVYDKAKAVAIKRGLSFNEYVHTLVEIDISMN
ncbi:MAG: hypothetical protein LBG48_02340 [Rickettsiales bacterium]|jgi:hypothetical protein|nr:hypothetical protein [Rickettsiales bacterium]